VVGILLVNPKFPHNVGGALRAAACFGADSMWWTGERVPAPESWPEGARLPREERVRIRETVTWGVLQRADDVSDLTPVCVERSSEAESLIDFVHPANPLYVFGPEDGGVPKGWRAACHRFVSIPTVNDGPLNLAAAINVVLYDRIAKAGATDPDPRSDVVGRTTL
jgi:tRNA(Leu) C34 or U34 (ribose-2'-O)-methylase TrmL